MAPAIPHKGFPDWFVEREKQHHESIEQAEARLIKEFSDLNNLFFINPTSMSDVQLERRRKLLNPKASR